MHPKRKATIGCTDHNITPRCHTRRLFSTRQAAIVDWSRPRWLAAVTQRLGNMDAAYLICARQIGNRAGDT